MTFEETLVEVRALLEREGRIAYRILKRRFDLSDDDLEDLKADLIDAKRVAVDEDGKVLVWIGQGSLASSVQSLESKTPPFPDARRPTLDPRPVSYTPPHLAERIRAEQAALEARGATDGERKTITALFADLKGSTALIEGLDPEDARAIIDPALQLMMDAVHRYEGYVAQALGDGIFALFGAPIAHEDHPQRALYAALRMQEEMRQYSDALRRTGRAPLQMRVGVNTGEVVVRSIRKDDLHTDYVPVGHSTNLAARMEQLANPGSILVTAHTQRLAEGYFEFKALGETQIKGVETLLNVYEVLGAGPLRTRLQVSATRRGLTRFVGRRSEMEQLQRALEQAKAGHGQIVGVMGEPGLGKSRLFHEFVGARHAMLLHAHGCLVLEAYSVSHGKASPYLPVIELLKDYFQIQPQDDERTRRQKVIGKVLELDRSLENTLPYVSALLGSEEQPSPLQQMDPQIRRQRTFDALKQLLLRESLKQSLILSFEDLHWIDSETQGFLDTLSESMASARILLLTNYRPEYRHEWGQKTYYTQLRLTPFGKVEAEEFLDALLGVPVGADLRVGPQEGAHTGAPLQSLKQLILEKTEGTPFFMEEIVQELMEQGVLVRDPNVGAVLRDRPQEGAHTGAPLQIPTTVQGVLAARIDRLAPDEKALLQQLAVIGREFPLSLLRRVISQPEDELYRLLASLQRKEFLYEQPAFPEVEYIFKHALTQDVAYGTVLHERRKVLHERTGQALEIVYAATLPEHYPDLAHHYSRSPNTEKAITYLQLAGQQAAQRSANKEAITHLTTALKLLGTFSDTRERAQQELALQFALGPALIAVRGYAAADVDKVYARAQELCRQVGDTAQLFPMLWGSWVGCLLRAELQQARELAEQLLHLAESAQDSALRLEAHYALGDVLFWQGEFALARVHLEHALGLYDPQRHRAQAVLYGQEERGVTSLSYAAWTLWCLGYADQALARTREALTLAHEPVPPFSQGFAVAFAALLHQFRREAHAVREQAETVIALSTEQGFPMWFAWGTILQGWTLAEQGQGEEGIAQMRQGLDAWQATGAELMRPYIFTLLAEGYGKLGQAEDGLAAIAEALWLVEKNDERSYEAEVYRIKGELTLQQSKAGPRQVSDKSKQVEEAFRGRVGIAHQNVSIAEAGTVGGAHPTKEAEVEGYFLKAIDIAQKQRAKSLELRAAMSLARLWQQQGKTTAARQMLAELYGWFTEGFDTKDLQEAKALLGELIREDKK